MILWNYLYFLYLELIDYYIQKQLNLSNGVFGTYVSLITLGSIIAFIVGSRIIHSFGIGRAFAIAIFGINLTMAGYPHVHSSNIFVLSNIFFGFFSTLTHISMNAQGIHIEHKSKLSVLPFMSGVWSMGALSTAVVAALALSVLNPTANKAMPQSTLRREKLLSVFLLTPIALSLT